MNNLPDYTKYSLLDLEDVFHAVNREKHPEYFQAIARERDKRKKECADDYAAAKGVLEKDGIRQARPLLERVAMVYRGSPEGVNAADLLREHGNDNGQAGPETIIPADKTKRTGKMQAMKLVFNGSAPEYFRVWIVNLCLTLLSFGIFSAWAKVRKKRYFYSHTTLDGTPFQYLGRPIPILKGRIIATVVFLIYYSSTNFFTPLLPYVFGAGVILAPWILVQSVSFNARYTAFRNMTFRFSGTYWDAIKVLSAWGIIPILILCILSKLRGIVMVGAILLVLLGFGLPWWLRNIKHFIVTRTSFGGQPGEFSATGGEFFAIYFRAGLVMVVFGIITTGDTMAGTTLFESGTRYKTEILTAMTYIGYIVSFGYIQASMTNTIWSQVRLGPLCFDCNLSAKDMINIYLTNALGIIFSVGFLIPWAVMRTKRYRIERTDVRLLGDLSEFQADIGDEVAAVGAEMSDFFDLDLGI